ncbi:hypothetical protein MD535_08320 [Vibrio sp. ZSDZ65]|uniref:Uncharacterized protein n=1 Tax=Vibrio qingdaonensis TaxID=2829491 RepID=A0A9X3HW47_9VIBR|nr:hypothetical protein [Vibrio qingdaonensis]MCW8346011.1 hypothetical protein [Vibrio qingdaonensis]
MFNISNQVIFPNGEQQANNQIPIIANALANDVHDFFTDVGVEKKYDLSNSALVGTNISNGVADARWAIIELKQNIIITAQELYQLACIGDGTTNYKVNEQRANDPLHKQHLAATEFIKKAKYLASKMGVNEEILTSNLFSNLIHLSRCLLIRLWRSGHIILPISHTIVSNNLHSFVTFKANNRRNTPPMFGATDEYVKNLSAKFEAIFFGYESANLIEREIVKVNREEAKLGINSTNFLLYCGQVTETLDLSSFDEVTRLSVLWKELNHKKQSHLAILKQLTDSVKPFEGFSSGLTNLKRICTGSLNFFHTDSLQSHSRKLTETVKNEIKVALSPCEFDFSAVLFDKDEQALFDFVVSNNVNVVNKALNDTLDVNFKHWDEYQHQSFKRQATTKSAQTQYTAGWNTIRRYLLYVAAWIEMFPDVAKSQSITIPETLKLLDRETFVIRSFSNLDIDNETWPRTLSDFLLQQSEQLPTSVRSCILSINENFALDQQHVPSQAVILSKEFTQHWHKHCNGIALGAHNESVKQTISREEFPFLLETAYSLESLGMYLQQRILEGYTHTLLGFTSMSTLPKANPYSFIDLKPKRSTRLGEFTLNYQNTSPIRLAIPLKAYQLKKGTAVVTNDLQIQNLRNQVFSEPVAGYTPIAWYLNDSLEYQYFRLDQPSSTLSNPFCMNKTSKVHIDGKNISIPLLGPIRGATVALEQGIRHIHIRHLDARHFDKYATDNTDVTHLLVQTEKTNKRPWKAPSHQDVISILRSEREFLRLRTDRNIGDLIKYSSSNQEIDVLFRNAAGKDFGEQQWNGVWDNLLLLAQQLINTHCGEYVNNCQFVKMVPLTPDDPMTYLNFVNKLTAQNSHVKRSFVDESKLHKHKFDGIGHRIKLMPIVTPHGSRTTFVSHRIGHMPLHLLARTVNQSGKTAVYYGVENAEETKALFESSRQALKIIKRTDSNESVRISSKAVSSKVEDAFLQSPSEAMNLYGMTSIPLVVIDKEGNEIQKKTGLDLLSSTPHSMIAFADTHICVHNLECPAEIVDENGGFQRCGVCRIKICHIDNLVSISAMMEKLEIDETLTGEELKSLNSNSDLDSNFVKQEKKRLKQKIDVISSEKIGWAIAQEAVETQRQRLLGTKNNQHSRFMIPAPTLLKESIKCEKVQQKVAEIFFNHALTTDDIPSLRSDKLRVVMARLTQKVQYLSMSASSQQRQQLAISYQEQNLSPDHILAPILAMIDAGIINKKQIIETLDTELINKPVPQKSLVQNQIIKTLESIEHA